MEKGVEERKIPRTRRWRVGCMRLGLAEHLWSRPWFHFQLWEKRNTQQLNAVIYTYNPSYWEG